MFMAKVFLDRKLMGVRVYEKHEHALSDAIDKDNELHSCLQEDKLMDFSTLKIVTVS